MVFLLKKLALLLVLVSPCWAQVLQHQNGGTDLDGCSTHVGYVLTWNGAAWECDPISGSGLSNVAMPTDLFASSITSGVETVPKQPQQPGYVLMGDIPSYNAYAVQPCRGAAFNTSATTLTCTLPQATSAANSLYVLARADGGTGSSSLSISETGASDTFTNISNNFPAGTATGLYYAQNISGGATAITVTVTGNTCSSNCDQWLWVVELAGVDTASVFDAGNTTQTVTTGNANDIIIASCLDNYPVIPTGGFVNIGSPTLAGGGYLASAFLNTSTTGTYATTWIPYNSCNSAGIVAFKAASTSTNTYHMQPLNWLAVNKAFPHLVNPPSSTIGDTGIDLHVGTPIYKDGASDYTAAVLFSLPGVGAGGTNLTLEVGASVDCSTSSATVLSGITYTSADSVAITIAGTTATCGGAGVATHGGIPQQQIRALAGTNVTFTTTHTGSPSPNVSALAKQVSSQ